MVIASRLAIAKPPFNGPLSQTAYDHRLPLLASQSCLSSEPTSPDNVAPNDTVELVWDPQSPLVSHIRQPALDWIISFVNYRGPYALHKGPQKSPFSVMQEFHNITQSTYGRVLRELDCMLFEYDPKVQYAFLPLPSHHRCQPLPPSIDYFGGLFHLVISIPGEAHELVADNAEIHLRKSLLDQGPYWPEWDSMIDWSEYTGTTDRKLTCPGQ